MKVPHGILTSVCPFHCSSGVQVKYRNQPRRFASGGKAGVFLEIALSRGDLSPWVDAVWDLGGGGGEAPKCVLN